MSYESAAQNASSASGPSGTFGLTGTEHDLPGFRVEHLPADIPEHERASTGGLYMEVEAGDRVRELIGAVDAPEEVLEHGAIDQRLACHRVRERLGDATAHDEFDGLAGGSTVMCEG
jgi:hypothetical protein